MTVRCCCRVLFPQLSPPVVDRIDQVGGAVVIAAHTRARGSPCRRCGRTSKRVHSRYRRRLGDLPISGRPVVLWLTVRRFFCDHVDCSAGTFVEQVPGITERHSRRSARLHQALASIGLALAGRPGSRVAATLGMGVSRTALLRLIRALPDPPVGQVAVLGVDEFALRRGRHYATVLVDLTGGHRPVDVLAGRDAQDFAGWLRAHPGVQVICRDRAGGYADGARSGAPAAVQVADRWHLWDNLCQHLDRVVAAHHACLPEPAAPVRKHSLGKPVTVLTVWPETTRIQHTRQRFCRTHDLRNQGQSIHAIARRLGVNDKTARRYLRVASAEALIAGGVRTSVLDPFKLYLHDRLSVGQHNATKLLAEITEQGYTGGYNTLNRYLRPLRHADRTALAALEQRSSVPTVRQVAGWITGLPGRLDPAAADRLKAIRARCPELDAAVRHVAGFARMIKDLSGDENTLTKWIGAVDADVPELRSFTAGLCRDRDAVVAGLTLPYNSGPVEGTVNRIKQLKAAMYGRAKLDLLRKRVLLS